MLRSQRRLRSNKLSLIPGCADGDGLSSYFKILHGRTPLTERLAIMRCNELAASPPVLGHSSRANGAHVHTQTSGCTNGARALHSCRYLLTISV
jgi:hypothetical protein